MEESKKSGDKSFKSHDFSEAVFHYTEALKLPPPEGEELRHKIHANLSAAYASLGNGQKALTEAEKALRVDENYARGHMRKGNALEMMGRLNEARAAYKKGADIAPDDTALQSAIKKLDTRRAEVAASRKAAAQAEKAANTSKAAEFKEAGNKLYRDKKYKAAVEKYTSAIEAAKEEKWADIHLLYGNRSICYLKLEQIQAALDDADLCIELKEDWYMGYSRRGDALQMKSEYEMARLAYLAGLKLNPTNPNLQAAVHQMDVKLGLGSPSQEHSALIDGEAGVANDDDEEDLYALLGLTKEADDEEIRKAYRKMARTWHPDKNPGDVQAAEMTRKINFAYNVFTTPVKKRAYDKYGAQGLEIYDQIGEEGFQKVEAMEPYMGTIMCCLCLMSIPTLGYCCCCFCCCCGLLKKEEEYDEYENMEEYDDLETGRTDAPDSHDAPPGANTE